MKYVIAWWQYFEDETIEEEDTGMTGWAEDHYEEFDTREEAEQALPRFLAFDEGAHIFEREE